MEFEVAEGTFCYKALVLGRDPLKVFRTLEFRA